MDFRNRWNSLRNSQGFQEFYFFAVALILAFGTLQTTGTVMDTDQPVVTVVSCSMYPHYGVGDIILVKGTDFENIEEGNIVVYDSGQQGQEIPIIHRVIEKNSDYLETQGDNNYDQLPFEKRVTSERIHGIALGSVPKIGLIKLVTMDLLGVSGDSDQLLQLDQIPKCSVRA